MKVMRHRRKILVKKYFASPEGKFNILMNPEIGNLHYRFISSYLVDNATMTAGEVIGMACKLASKDKIKDVALFLCGVIKHVFSSEVLS
jgi:hypothetical protein